MKKNIKNMKDVLDVLLKRDYEIIEITSKIECVEYVPYCEDCGTGKPLRLYYDKATGAIIENYQEQIEVKKEIKRLQEQLKRLQERNEEDEDI